MLATRTVTIISFLLITSHSFTQHRGKIVTDSLLHVLSKTKDETKKTDLLNLLSREFRDRGLKDSSLIFAEKALSLAKRINYTKGEIDSHLNIGNTCRELKDLPKAIKHIEQLIQLCEVTDDLFRKGDAYDNLGHIYHELKDTTQALKNHLLSLKIREQINDEYGIGNSNDNIGHLYSSKSEFSKALTYFQASLKQFKKIGDESRIALSSANVGYQYYYMGNLYDALVHFDNAGRQYKNLNNTDGINWMINMLAYVHSDLGNYEKSLNYYFEQLKLNKDNETGKGDLYMKIGRVYMMMEKFGKAMEYELKAMAIAEKQNNQESVMYINYYIGEIYFLQNNVAKGLNYFSLSHDYAIKTQNVYWTSVTKERIGRCYFLSGKVEEAEKWIREGLSISKHIYTMRDISQNYLILSKIDSIQGNYPSSLENYKLHIEYENKSNKEEATKLAQQLEFKEKEEQVIKDQQEKERRAAEELSSKNFQKNTAIGGMILMSLLVLAVLYLVRLRNKKIKAEKQNLKLKQREIEAVKETEQFKSRFLANISHEFRTPLTLINGNIDLLKQKSNQEDLKKLEEIDHNGNRLLQLVNQLLDLSKMESGQYTLNYTNGNLLNEAQAYISAFDSFSSKEGIELTMTITDDARKTLSEKQFSYSSEALHIIINNLLSNALKFTPEGGNVHAEIDFQNSILTIKVADTGPGIPEKHLSGIFDRFYQVEEVYNSTQKGSGIGLTLVKELAYLHHGDVTVCNNPGGGCTFKVWITCKKTDIEAIAEQDTEDKTAILIENTGNTDDQPEISGEKPIILVIEDQPELRRFIAENIGEDYSCIEAENGKTGYELAQKHIPDLIISDVMMPEMNGFELCKSVKENGITSHIPVILLTAKADKNDKIAGLEIGADDYILKPFSIEELRLRVRNSIRLQQSLRNKFKNGQIPEREEEFPELSPYDRDFLLKLTSTIKENISNSRFTVTDLAEAVHLSQSQLTRKLKAVTGHTPSDLIKNIRFEKALALLRENMSISDVSWSVGFEDPAYFGKAFKKHFGIAPSEFQNKK